MAPDAAVLYRGSRTDPAKGGAIHVSGRISDFVDWATSSRYPNYGYSKDPEAIARGILKDAIDEPMNTNTVKYIGA